MIKAIFFRYPAFFFFKPPKCLDNRLNNLYNNSNNYYLWPMSENEKQLRQSKQRNRLLEVLRSTESHPTADWLYEQLKQEFPNLSLGTVYRNLATLVDHGLVKKIHFGSTYDRFEANTHPHYHLICESCGTIIDFDMPIRGELNHQAEKLTSFTITHHSIDFFGVCKTCKK